MATLSEAFALFLFLALCYFYNSISSGVDRFVMFFVEYRHIFISAELLISFMTLVGLSERRTKYRDTFCVLFSAVLIAFCCIFPNFLIYRGEDLAAPAWGLYFFFPLLVFLFCVLHYLVPKCKNTVTILGGCALNIFLLLTLFHKSLVIWADFFAFRVPF